MEQIIPYAEFEKLYMPIMAEAELLEYKTEYYCKKFHILYEHLVKTNEKYNLTAITDAKGVITRHFADSLTACKHIPKGAVLIDVGTGGGFPSLPLAIAREDISITALDSTAKKLGFIDEVSGILELKNIKTLAARAEEVGVLECREKYDVAISRAVARLNMLAELCLPLVKIGGLFVAMKASDGLNELDEAEKGIEVLGGKLSKVDSFELSDSGARNIIIVNKEKETPAKYPRAFAKIKKSPL